METGFKRNQKIIEKIIEWETADEIEQDEINVIFIDENKDSIMIYLDFANKGLPKEIEELELTCDGISYPNKTQEIPEEFDEDIVVLFKEETKITTCLGFEVKLIAK